MFGKKKSFYLSSSKDENDRRLLGNICPENIDQEALSSYDLLIVGSGGIFEVHLAINAAKLGYTTCLVEKEAIAANYFLFGELPTNSLLEASKQCGDLKSSTQRVKRVRADISENYSYEMLRALGVDVFFGDVKFLDANTLKAGKTKLSFKKAFIKTPYESRNFQIDGIKEKELLCSKKIFELKERPEHLLIAGSSKNTIELAEAFSNFGSQVTIITRHPNLLEDFSKQTSEALEGELKKSGISVLKDATIFSGKKSEGNHKIFFAVGQESETSTQADTILQETGIKLTDITALELKSAEIKFDSEGLIIDEHFKTAADNIFSSGSYKFSSQLELSPENSASLILSNILKGKKHSPTSLTLPQIIKTSSSASKLGEFSNEENQISAFLAETNLGKIKSDISSFLILETEEGSDKIKAAEAFGEGAEELISFLSFLVKEKIGLSKISNFPESALGSFEILKVVQEKVASSRGSGFKDNLLRKFKLF